MIVITIEGWKGGHKVITLSAMRCELDHTSEFPDNEITLSVWNGNLPSRHYMKGGEKISVCTEGGRALWGANIHDELLDYRTF